jgi:outer membrane protein assembly factor BamE
MRSIVTVILAAALSACGVVYKIDVQQGNYVTQDVVSKLKKGMTKGEVKQLLGTPLLSDAFHNNRWDYYFSNAKSGGGPWYNPFTLFSDSKGSRVDERTRLSVFFEDDKLVAVTGDVRPALAPPGGPTTPAAPSASAPAPKQ